MASRPRVSLALVAACSLWAVMPRPAVAQHITVDGRFSPAQTLIGPNYSIGANLGKQVGSNLFQSFGQFSLSQTPTPESATFTPTGSTGPIGNVIGRVTGNSVSSINGAINSTIAGANLYLINPSGIVFGPNATVNVSGSFHASTADYLKMSDGAKFQATNPDGSTLSAAPPAAFGFLTAQPAAITVNGSTLGPVPGTLGLVAGPVSISGGRLQAPAGTIHVTGVAGVGEVPVNPGDNSALTVTSFGPVQIATLGSTRSTLTVSNTGVPGNGGSVFIRSGALTIDASTIEANNSGSGPGGQVVLRGDSQVTLSNGAQVQAIASSIGSGPGVTISTAPAGVIRVDASTVTLGTTGSGDGGPLSVQSGQLTLSNGAALRSLNQATGNGGTIAISADSVLLDGGAALNLSTGIFSTTSGAGSSAGSGGSITIVAGELTLHNGAGVLAQSSGTGAGGEVAASIGSLIVDSGASLGTRAVAGGNAGNFSAMVAGQVTIDMTIGEVPSILDGIGSATRGSGNAGNVTVTAGVLTITNNGRVESLTRGAGNSGDVSVTVAGMLSLNGSGGMPGAPTGIIADSEPGRTGNAGAVSVSAGSISIVSTGEISSSAFGSGNGGSVSVSTAGGLTIDGAMVSGFLTGITSEAEPLSTGNAGTVSVSARSISILNAGAITSDTFGPGNSGSVFVSVAGGLTIDGATAPLFTGISSEARSGSTGNAGPLTVSAGSVSIANDGRISSATLGSGNGGSMSVAVAGQLSIVGAPGSSVLTGISSQTQASGDAGTVAVTAGALSIAGTFGEISSNTFGSGKGGSVSVMVDGQLTIDGIGAGANLQTGLVANAREGSTGKAGDVTVAAGALSIVNGGEISSSAFGRSGNLPASTGSAGSVAVSVAGLSSMGGSGTRIATEAQPGTSGNAGSVAVRAAQITIGSGAEVVSTTAGTGAGGSVLVTTPGALVLDGAGVAGTQIAASATGPNSGPGGSVTVNANALTVEGGAQIASSTAGPGNGGSVQITAQGPLTLTDPGSGITASATSTASGSAGSVIVNAPQISLMSGAEIASTTAGTGAGGSVLVTTPGMLVLNGSGVPNTTQIAASATDTRSGPGGSVTVRADTLTVEGGAQIASTTAGPGKGGDIGVTVANGVTLSGGGPNSASGITASAGPGSSGQAGQIVLMAGGAIALSGGAEVTTSTAGSGNGGSVQVTVQGPLTLTDPGTGITASATPTASGNAGSVTVTAPQVALMTGAEIASTTAGTGAGGSVSVTTPGTLVLNGNGDPATQIATSAIGPQSGPGGSVIVNANALTVEGGAQIASSTAGPGKGGDVNVMVASNIVLPDPGPQITAQSTGSGDAGSITVSADRLLMNNGAAISTQAETSTASGGNITLNVGDFLYLVSSEITTSVKGETGNGGNIAIDPQFAILNHSSIIAQAIEGHGGNITITADQFIPSSDSIVSASSELGISGTIVINGPLVDVNGALVVLSTQLRSRTEVLREACAARAGQPISSLVQAGRGGLPQDPEATLPALYIAGRDVGPSPPAAAGPTEASGALQTTVHLTMRCG